MDRADRACLADAFLAEAVFASRAKQAVGTFIAQSGSSVGRQCGLGANAEVVLDLTPRAKELFDQLWPGGVADLERTRDVMRAWVEDQDAFDRRRNHFLKAFRQEHGVDRKAYSPELRAEFERGLAQINAEVEAARRAAASRLVD